MTTAEPSAPPESPRRLATEPEGSWIGLLLFVAIGLLPTAIVLVLRYFNILF